MKVLNFGSVNLDHIYQLPHFPSPGETLASSSYRVKFGGKGLNQSVALANAGATVFHAGCIGKDGLPLREYLIRHAVHTEYLETVEVPTGHAIITINTTTGDNCILLYGGANHCIDVARVDRAFEQFGADDFLVLQNEINGLEFLLEKAKARRMSIVLNPSPISPSLLRLPADAIDWLILNEIEGAAFCKKAAPETMLTLLHERFPSASILLTLGKAGSVCYTHGKQFSCPAFPVSAVDTTAAGDTFTGFAIAEIGRGNDVQSAMRIAAAAAAITVTRLGAAETIPTSAEVHMFLDRDSHCLPRRLSNETKA